MMFADRFRLEAEIGMGGMSMVYAAHDLERDRQVALKVLRFPEKKLEVGLERFRRETETLRRVNHPGIVGIEDCGVLDTRTAWIAMELLDGETLRERVERVGPFSLEELIPVVDTAADALAFAHSVGIVHRDLKPDNLFLPSNPGVSAVKIIDFGLSRVADAKKLTQTGSVVGTPRYMAPEQIASAHTADPRVDVYALGVIVYEALAGSSPFVASDHGQLLGAIIQGRMEPLERTRPDLSSDIARVIERATAPSPDDRYETTSAFAKALRKAAEGKPVTYRDIRRPDSTSRPSLPSWSGVDSPVGNASLLGRVGRFIVWAVLLGGFGASITYVIIHALRWL
jgi:eukaryotic-like serine/threonine-protein kinase